MLFAPQSTQKTIFETLNNDSALQTLLGGANKVFDRVPDNQPFPFITIGDGVWNNRDNESTDGLGVDLVINTWYREPGLGRLKVQEIQKRIDELIHRKEPCIEAWNIVSLSRGTINIILDPDNMTLHGIQTFKLMIGES